MDKVYIYQLQKHGRDWVFLAALLFFTIGSFAQGNFTIVGTKVYDPEGKLFIPVGANVNGYRWVWDGLVAGQSDLITQAWKFNCLRMNYENTYVANPNYNLDIAAVDAMITEFTAKKVVMQIANHDYTCNMPTLADAQNILVPYWVAQANKYKNNPYVWLNIANELGGMTGDMVEGRTHKEQSRQIHKMVIQAIRTQTTAKNIIVVDGLVCGHDRGGFWGDPAITDESHSLLLSHGQEILAADPTGNTTFSVHSYGWGGQQILLRDFISRVQAKGLSMHLGEVGWYQDEPNYTADASKGVQYAFGDGNFDHVQDFSSVLDLGVGALSWHYQPGDGMSLTIPGGGNSIDSWTNPTNLSWAGKYFWQATHEKGFGYGSGTVGGETELSRTGWVASASIVTGDSPSKAIDNNIGSRFSPQLNQASGQWWSVNLGAQVNVSRIQLEYTYWASDYPRGYAVYVSNDGVNWGTAIVTGTGSNSAGITSIPFPSTVSAKYIKVQLTVAATSTWFSIAEFHAYTSSSTPPPPPTGTTFNGHYKIIAKHSLKAIDVAALSLIDGGIVHQWTYGGANNQLWSLPTATTEGYYTIINKNSGKVLDVSGNSTADGAYIHQWNNYNTNNQQWSLVDVGGGYYNIKSRSSGKCLDIQGISTANGARLTQWTCGTGDNQKFQIEYVSGSTGGRMGVVEKTLLEERSSEQNEKLSAYPNPANGFVTVRFYSPQDTDVIITLFNLLKQSRLEVNTKAHVGINNVKLSISNVPAGMHIIQLQKGKVIENFKLNIKN